MGLPKRQKLPHQEIFIQIVTLVKDCTNVKGHENGGLTVPFNTEL